MPTDHSHEPTIYNPPPEYVIDTLRAEIANLNDQRMTLQTQVNFQVRVIEGLSNQLHELEHRLELLNATDPVEVAEP